MTHTLTRFKQLTLLNSSWALLIGIITIALKVALECPGCQPDMWAYPLYWSSTAIGLGLALIVSTWVWHSFRQNKLLIGTTLIMLLTLSLEIGLTVITPQPTLATALAHTLMVTFYFSLTLLLATIATAHPTRRLEATIVNRRDRYYFHTLLIAGAATLTLLVTGVVIKMMGATSACLGWPLCESGMADPYVLANLLHRTSALIIGILTMGLVLQTQRNYRHHRPLVRWSTMLALLFLAQMAVGAFYSLASPLVEWVGLFHLILSVAMWGGLVVMATLFYVADKPAYVTLEPPITLTRKEKTLLYFKLIKPFVLILLLLTTIVGMVIAAKGWPGITLMLVVFFGGVLSAGGASVLNSYVDSDIDGQMSRTARRATVTGLIVPEHVLTFGLTLSGLSIITFLMVNPLSTFLSMLGLLYYLFFYTMYLKRNTIHNIIIGGAAGAIPPLVGWAAVTNSLNLEALYLFAIIFFWTPPHTWAMALLVKKDYARVKVPMLPVIVGEAETTYQTLLYSILMVTITLLPVSFGMASWLYLAAAILLNAQFLRLAWRMYQDYTKATSKRLYKYSQSYLALIFLAMAIDRIFLG